MTGTLSVWQTVVRRLIGIADRTGLDAATVLKRAGIPQNALTDPQVPVTIEQASDLTRELWILTGDELFGLGAPLPHGSFHLLMQSVIHVPDLGSALSRLADGSRILPGLPTAEPIVDGTTVSIRIDTSAFDDPDHLLAELVAILTHRVLSWMAGSRIPLHAVSLPWPSPEQPADYDDLFGCAPTFDAPHLAIAFDAATLKAPVVQDEPSLAEFLGDQPRVWFAQRDWGATPADQVRTMLAQGLNGNGPSSDEIAGRLSISTQHLRRVLRQHGTSLGELKQEVLRDAAITSLQSRDEPVDQLARRLGFSEASAFRRAFRRWTGKPPSAFRGARRASAASDARNGPETC
jgi:AraC-like DNA-binding protein